MNVDRHLPIVLIPIDRNDDLQRARSERDLAPWSFVWALTRLLGGRFSNERRNECGEIQFVVVVVAHR